MLRVSVGSAQMSMVVRSGPMPASASAAATLTLAGKPLAASRALPEKTSLGSVMPSISILLATRYGAPTSPLTGLRVFILTDWISSSIAAVTAFRPSSAPAGTMIWPPHSRASSSRCGAASSAPTLTATKVFPAASTRVATCTKRSAGRHSTTMSAVQPSASSGTGFFSVSRNLCALALSRAATPTRLKPGMPSSSLRASALPMAPSPAMATFWCLVGILHHLVVRQEPQGIGLEDLLAQRRIRIGELLVRLGEAHREGPVRAEEHVILPMHRSRELERIGIVGDAVDAESLEGETRLLGAGVGAGPAGGLAALQPARHRCRRAAGMGEAD